MVVTSDIVSPDDYEKRQALLFRFAKTEKRRLSLFLKTSLLSYFIIAIRV